VGLKEKDKLNDIIYGHGFRVLRVKTSVPYKNTIASNVFEMPQSQ